MTKLPVDFTVVNVGINGILMLGIAVISPICLESSNIFISY
ncbi:MAG TPA: hypothetical protein P5518_02810 [Candidatus Cloacimonas sp.]|nr:hypothetical protein [Candidatus Cloacimonadota bacterium]HNV92474.1 hypothetical protein [Candidatus Cloacimonas sp.]HPV64232.1 hypothetical protein [Candidatus Cloacimonas sp.]HPZ01965.1 hypothetical protein [Candidatus Cloacimonas sp.]HQB49967.1 hypothetical protein [Candidatus Cloacimonas sp.]